MPGRSKARAKQTQPVADPDLSPEWIEEINRRVDDIESGRVQCIPAGVAHRWLQEKIPSLKFSPEDLDDEDDDSEDWGPLLAQLEDG